MPPICVAREMRRAGSPFGSSAALIAASNRFCRSAGSGVQCVVLGASSTTDASGYVCATGMSGLIVTIAA